MSVDLSFENSSKKIPLENLTKDDLLVKYKALLTLAQKAKLAKDALIKEIADLKRTKNDDHSLDQNDEEFPPSTTINPVEDDTQSASHHEQQQIRTLTDENERLARNLGELEAQIEELKTIGLQQQSQLLSLEQSGTTSLPQLQEDECLRNANDRLKEKIKFYHTRMVKFVQDVKHLKQARNELTSTFSLYVVQVSDWKAQLVTLLGRIVENQEEMQTMRLQNESLEFQLIDVREENAKWKQYFADLLGNFENITECNENKNDAVEVLVSSSSSAAAMFNILDKDIKNLYFRISYLENELETENKNCAKAHDLIKLNESGETKMKEAIRTIVDKCGGNDTEFIKQYESEINLLKQHLNISGDITFDSYEIEYVEITELNVLLNKFQLQSDMLKLTRKILSQLDTTLFDKPGTVACGIQTNNDETEDRLKKENAELLVEMNEMNQVLKERGETISKQQTFFEKAVNSATQKDELIKNLQQELRLLKSNEAQTTNEEVLRTEISNLRNEIEEMRNKLQNVVDPGDACSIVESETMSVSTVSRIDDVNRMKDLEGSWEERYGKLRSFAVKLKCKTKDLMAELAREQAEKLELQQKLAKTANTFQQQMDGLQDNLESSKSNNDAYLKKLESVAAEISKDKQKLAQNEELISKLKSEVENLMQDKVNTENWKKQVSSKVQSLKNEIKASALLKKEFENKVAKLNSDLEAKDKALKNESEKHNQTKSSLQESLEECKKLSALNMQHQDYERVAEELDKRQEHVASLKTQLDSCKVNLNDALNEKKLLEDSVGCAISENNLHISKLSELEKLLQERDQRLQGVSHTLESCRLENEDLTRQLSDSLAEHQKLVDSLKVKEGILKSQSFGLERQLRQIQESLKLKEDELQELRGDYDNYKIRAKSVMQQSRDFGTEEKLIEESTRLRAQIDGFKEEVNELRSDINHIKAENDNLSLENQKLRKHNETVEREVEENRTQYDRLLLEHQLSITEHAEAVRGFKVHTEKLSECYQQQLTDQETRHNIEISELQHNVSMSLIPANVPTLVPPSMVREEGEGSENVDGISGNTIVALNAIVPLEKLLSNESDREMLHAKRLLTENEIKVTHLTALLADAEQDLAKHVQMNKVLKEEIRRQQRCVEREEHAENLEYLKNVVFKFLTLGNGDERTRLVPVLNTILKLSPEENRKLILASKSDKSWSSYLPGSWAS